MSQSVIWRERIRGRILVNTLAPVERIVCRVHVEFFFLFLFFLSFFSLVSLLSLSRSSSFASLYLYPSNFQRRRLEEKKRTCTNNPDLSFLVSFFFPPFFSSLSLRSSPFLLSVSSSRGVFAISSELKCRGIEREEGERRGDSRVRLFVKRHPPPFFPTRTISFAFLSFLDFQFIANFKWIKVFFSPSLLSKGEFLVGIEADCY